jgi:hypothetical protein
MFNKWLCLSLLIHSTHSVAQDYTLHGVLDFRATTAKTLPTYVDGGYGKFSSNDGANLSVAQAGVEFTTDWQSGLTARLVANAYSDETETILGITEAFLKYRSIPNNAGYRWQIKAGIFYPEISLENNAYAWASKNTINSSAINTWIGEEIRLLGSELALTRLGKFNQSAYDITLAASAFVNNDTAGTLLSWHGWNIGNRQTLWADSRPIPNFFARRPGNDLDQQAPRSQPFIEMDNKVGIHLRSQIKFVQKGEIALGYYDNLATPYIVENGQYVWRTRFSHLGFKWQLTNSLELSGQYLNGDTLMQSTSRVDVVNNDYTAAYLALSKKIKKHRLTVRLEEFSVTDNDQTLGDDNSEYGQSATANYTYRFNKPWLLSLEYNVINSERPSRSYTNMPVELTEHQWQASARYFF